MTITRYLLPNGKLVVIIEGVKKAVFQQWLGEPWEPVDQEIFRHTPIREVKAEVRGF